MGDVVVVVVGDVTVAGADVATGAEVATDTGAVVVVGVVVAGEVVVAAMLYAPSTRAPIAKASTTRSNEAARWALGLAMAWQDLAALLGDFCTTCGHTRGRDTLSTKSLLVAVRGVLRGARWRAAVQ